jgi:hypothetical protein
VPRIPEFGCHGLPCFHLQNNFEMIEFKFENLSFGNLGVSKSINIMFNKYIFSNKI